MRKHLVGFLSLPICSCALSPDPVLSLASLPADGAAGAPSLRLAAPPQDPFAAPPARMRNYFDFMLGASYWGNLGGLDPTGVSVIPGAYQDFDRLGFAFDIGYDRVIASGQQTDWTLGIETGWSSFENDGSGLTSPYSDINASMYYVAPATRLLVHVSPTVTVSPGVGLGYYGFAIDELQSYYYGWWWGYDSRTLNQDSSLGGFVSLALDFNTSPTGAIRLDTKAHFVDFGGLQSLYPNETSVTGPIWNVELGFVVKF